MQKLKMEIEKYIVEFVRAEQRTTKYGHPLTAYADASDLLFTKLKEVANPKHLEPYDLLPDAKTVLVFFLPFAKEVVKANRGSSVLAKEWAVAYSETNALLYEISKGLKALLAKNGFKCAFVEPTNNFDKIQLVSSWSHKHVAYIAGMGQFGLNRQLITSVGCAGRISSIVTDAELEPDQRLNDNHLHRMCANCGWCNRGACPVKALDNGNWDKQRCWEWLQENEKHFPELEKAQCCGKCVVGPCAII